MLSRMRVFSVFVVWCFLITMSLPAQAQETASDFVEATVDRTSAYVGEPILYTWRWYLGSTTVDTSKPIPVELPSFDAFGQETLELSGEAAMRSGQAYQIITQQIVLYPRREGVLVIEPLRVMVPETPFAPAKPLESVPLSLTIKPLPANAPPTFGNAIGQFNLQAALDRQEAKTGDPVTLTMTITGSGNGPLIYSPQLTLGAEWRVYTGESSTRRDGPLLGERIFNWTLIPLQPGPLTVSSQAWSFLNPQTGQYETRMTTPFTVSVTGDAISEPQVVPAVAEPTLYPLYYSSRDDSLGQRRDDEAADLAVLSRMPEMGLRNGMVRNSGGINQFVLICGVVPPILALMVWLWSRFRGVNLAAKPDISRKRKRGGTFQDRLVALAQKPPQDVPLGVQAILKDYLAQKHGLSITHDSVDALEVFPVEIRVRLQACFDAVEAARYAPFTSDDARGLLQEAQRVMRRMEAS